MHKPLTTRDPNQWLNSMIGIVVICGVILGRESFNKDIRGAGNVSINWHKLNCFLKIGNFAIGDMIYFIGDVCW